MNGGLAGCISTFSSDITTTVLARPLGTLSPNTLTVTSILTGADLGQVTMWAQPITVAFQQRDLTLFSASTSPASPASTAAFSGATSTSRSLPASASASVNGDAASQSSTEGPGLSSGAKAGIGVGVALGVVAILCFAIFMLLRRRKRYLAHKLVGTHSVPVPARDADVIALRVVRVRGFVILVRDISL